MAGRPSSPHRAPSTPQIVPDSSRQLGYHLVTKKPLCGCNPTPSPPETRNSPLFGFPSKAPAHRAMIDRPDRTDFHASQLYRKPNFETRLPDRPPPFSSGRLRPGSSPSCLQGEKGRRARAPSPGPAGGIGDKDAAAPLRPPGPSLGDSSAPPHTHTPRSCAAVASPHRWLRGPGSRVHRCNRPTNNGRRKLWRPRLGPSAARGPAACRETD